MNKAKTIGNIMLWGSIAAMVIIFGLIEPLHLSFEIYVIIMILLFVIGGLSHFYIYAKIGEITDNYLIIYTGINCHIKYKIYFHEIDNIDVKHGYYNADFIVNFKNKGISNQAEIIKYNIVDWGSLLGLKYPERIADRAVFETYVTLSHVISTH